LLITSPDCALSFYDEIAGWGNQPFNGGNEPYTMWTNGETPIGGVMQLPKQTIDVGAPPNWLALISMPDVKATVVKAQQLSATVQNEESIPEVGSFVIISNPRGAIFAVYLPAADTPGHDGPPDEGEFSWCEFPTTDWEAAWSLYSELFGWQEFEQMDMGDMDIYQMFNKPPEVPVVAWVFYIRVPDCAAAVDKVKMLAGRALNGSMEVPDGDMVAQCMDPESASFAVHSAAGG